MNLTISHVETRRQAAVTIQQRILERLEWGELYYCQFKYQRGLQYLHCLLAEDDASIDTLERDRIFWSWWRNHWTLRDEEFLAEIAGMQNVANIRRIYIAKHHPESLALEIYPNTAFLD